MATKKNEIIEIKPLQLATVNITIEGDTPLIIHNWSEKSKKEMLDTQKGIKIKKKIAKNEWAECAGALWWMDGAPNIRYEDWDEETYYREVSKARLGFPATAIKQAAISALYRAEMSKDKVSLQGCFFIRGEGSMQLVEIKSPHPPTMREDNVKVGMGTADLRYRPEFSDWSIDLELVYNVNGKMSLNDIVNALNLGGFTVGIGEWRTEKTGQFGSFHVRTE